MAPRSQYAARRKEIEAEFQKGLEPAAVAAAYPTLPRSTIYEWHKKYQKAPPDNPESNVIRLVNSDVPQTDLKAQIRWVRAVMKQHILSPGDKTAVAVQAAQAFLKTIAMESALPKEEDDEPLSDSERLKRVAELFDAARTRRVGQAPDSADG